MNPLLHSSFNQTLINEYGIGLSVCEQLVSELDSVGFGVLRGVVNAKTLASLSLEAAEQRNSAKLVSGAIPCAHSARLSKLGSRGFDFLTSHLVEGFLKALFREPLVLSEDASCYTYYGPDDCLGPHLDNPVQCRITIIIYIDVKSLCLRGPETGLQLRILEMSDGNPGPVRAVLPTVQGEIVVGLGSEHWHERPPLQVGEHVTALTACFSHRA